MGKQRRQARRQKRAAKQETRQAKREVRNDARTERKEVRRENIQQRREIRQTNRDDRRNQKQNSLQGRRGIGRAVRSIGGGIRNTVQSAGEIIRDTGAAIGDTRFGQALENSLEAKRKLTVRYWASSNGKMSDFPETTLPEVMNRPDIGICFSGGGNRSAVASFGQMRALVSMGLDKKLRYTSSISGGAWFAVPYTFLPNQISDNDFFGEYIPMENIKSIGNLRENARKSRFCLNAVRGKIWGRSFAGAAINNSIAPIGKDENWSRAVGNVYLKPLGLFDSQRVTGENRFFTWSNLTRDRILASNRFLEANDFHTVEKDRPFNITIGALGRSGSVPLNSVQRKGNYNGISLFEMTPYYSGVSTSYSNMGGGYVESFGQDSSFEKAENAQQVSVRLGMKHNRFTLSDVIGVSGAALGAIDELAAKTFTPDLKHWSIQNKITQTYNAMDGGHLDFLGIMPLLKRKVRKIIVCANAEEGFVKHKNNKPNVANVLMANIEHLFGETKETSLITKINRFRNHVLGNSQNELHTLKHWLRVNNTIKGVSFYRGTYQVMENSNYGITPYQVDILWYVLDKSDSWIYLIEKLEGLDKPSTVRGVVDSLKKHFPNYPTGGLNLSEEEVSLLSNFTHWCFLQMADELKDFFN